jgi:hypothetical protein
MATAFPIVGDTLPTDLRTNGLCSTWFRPAVLPTRSSLTVRWSIVPVFVNFNAAL